ncbi:MAG: ADP-ribosylglycohydrolase family protein [Anaerolineales bacterium]|nr:ADP-ribosylglycohydrolase family protein [Anaerolineales bacterium]
MSITNVIQRKITGALLGLAIGDALGAPYENLDTLQIRQLIGEDSVMVFNGGGTQNYRPGQGTDDTELAFLVAESLLLKKSLDMEDISERLIEWGRKQTFLGPSTGWGLRALEAGVHFREAGNTQSASSGCLPRCLPLALVFTGKHLVHLTVDCCSPTHRHPLAIASSVAQNLLISELLEGKEWAEAIRYLYKNNLCDDVVDLNPILQAIDGDFHEPGAVDVLTESIHCVSNASNTVDALTFAVRMGGDTDTRAAITGAFAGVIWSGEFPDIWLRGCEASEAAITLGEGLANLRKMLSLERS